MDLVRANEHFTAERSMNPVAADPFVSSLQVSHDANIAEGVRFGRDVTIHEGVEIAAGVEIGNRVTLRNCILREGVRIEENCIVGYGNITGGFSHKLEGYRQKSPAILGEETLVRPGSVLYQAVEIGKNCWINHMVMLREHTHVGDRTSIGTMSDSEGYNVIGSHVSIHSQVQLCARLTIEDYVFIAPMTVFANGSPMNYARNFESVEQAATVRFGAQIAVNCVIMPRVEVGYESVVGPSSLVSQDVPDLSMVMGYPARVIQRIPPEQRMPVELRRRYYGASEEPPPRGKPE
jgi:acetyltransferase-like isoleucine patch superfamily enzyme